MIYDDEADLFEMYTAALRKQNDVLTVNSDNACLDKYMQ